jgi:hypothetical protein
MTKQNKGVHSFLRVFVVARNYRLEPIENRSVKIEARRWAFEAALALANGARKHLPATSMSVERKDLFRRQLITDALANSEKHFGSRRLLRRAGCLRSAASQQLWNPSNSWKGYRLRGRTNGAFDAVGRQIVTSIAALLSFPLWASDHALCKRGYQTSLHLQLVTFIDLLCRQLAKPTLYST